jgi:hypothetical protein
MKAARSVGLLAMTLSIYDRPVERWYRARNAYNDSDHVIFLSGIRPVVEIDVRQEPEL